MTAGASDTATEFTLARDVSAAKPPTHLEREVIALFEQLRGPVLRYLISFPIPLSDAEEMVQEAFLLLFTRLRSGRTIPHPRGWVFRTAYHLALKHRARGKRQSERFLEIENAGAIPAEGGEGPLARLEDKQQRECLMAVIRAMPWQHQQCLSLRAEGLRYREIAQVLGISLGSVANVLERSLSRLSRAMELRGGLR